MRTIKVAMQMHGDAGALNTITVETIAPETPEEAHDSGREAGAILLAFAQGFGEAASE